MAILAPSILSANFARLGADMKIVEAAGAGMIHIDVMDGQFVPNITIGPVVVRSLRKVTNLPLDVHLMIEHPSDHIDAFIEAGADFISFHYEAAESPHSVIRKVREKGVKAGLALNPSTPIDTLSDIIQELDFVLIMSVHPGFPAQKFIDGADKKVAALKKWIETKKLQVKIEVDGGITEKNIIDIKNAGADYIVAGSAVFGSKNPRETVKKMVRWIGGID